MKSRNLTAASCGFQFVAGLALLFLPDTLLPALIDGFPVAGVWLGQLLGAAWLGLAALNYLNRSALLGGIYGRPVIAANLAAYFIGGGSIVGTAGASGNAALLTTAATMLLFAAAYAWLMFKGPLQNDQHG